MTGFLTRPLIYLKMSNYTHLKLVAKNLRDSNDAWETNQSQDAHSPRQFKHEENNTNGFDQVTQENIDIQSDSRTHGGRVRGQP